jgi:hypothetical protein
VKGRKVYENKTVRVAVFNVIATGAIPFVVTDRRIGVPFGLSMREARTVRNMLTRVIEYAEQERERGTR